MTLTRVPKPKDRASFWTQLSPAARGLLERQGVDGQGAAAPAIASRPTSTSVAPPSSSSSSANRHERRALEQLERPRPAKRPGDAYMQQLQRDDERLQRLRASIVARGGDLSRGDPRLIPRRVLVLARTIRADASGFAIRAAFRRCRNKVAVGAIQRAALVPDADGTARYTWADERARCIAALGLALLELAVPTVRRGGWSGMVRGIPRGALCMLLASPWEPTKRPSVAALVGTHRAGGTFANGQVGYLRALIEAGFCYAQQLPAAQVEGFEKCWESGYASNRYWIVTGEPTKPMSDDQKRALLELHTRGLDAHRERLRRARRTYGAAAAADVAARAAAALGAAEAQAPHPRPPD